MELPEVLSTENPGHAQTIFQVTFAATACLLLLLLSWAISTLS